MIRFMAPRAALRRRMSATLSQTRISYREAGTCVDARRWPRRGPAPGDRAPDLASAAPPLMLALAATPWFSLVTLPGAAEDPRVLTEAARIAARWPGLVHVVRVVQGICPEGHVVPDTVYDPDGEFREAYAPRGDELCVIRPDGHIGARAPLGRAAAIEAYLEGLIAGVAS